MNSARLRDIALFATLSDEALREIEAAMPAARWPAGSVLLEEGAPGDSLCVVIEGTVEVVKALGTAEEWRMRQIGPGNFVGELALLDPGGVRSASVRAVTAVEVAWLSRARFDDLLTRQPRVAFQLVEILSRRLRESNDATIRDLRAKNSQLESAYRDLQAAQVQLVEKELLERDLQLAHDLQQSMLPRALPVTHGFDFSALMSPARAVGGDFFDFVELGSGNVGIVVADVSDKGMPAALYMALARSLIRAEASRGVFPPEVLRRVNHHLLDINDSGMFVTVLYGILHTVSGEFLYARAGHELPLLFDAQGTALEVRRHRGQPLGLLSNPALDEQSISLPSGGRLVLNTDGVTDAINDRQETFGVQRLRELIGRAPDVSSQTLCNAISAAVKAHEGSMPRFDDFTLVVVTSQK